MPKTAAPKVDPKPSIQVDKLVGQFIAMRDRIKEMEEWHELQLQPFKVAKEKIAGVLLQFLDDTGQESARTSEGTVSVTHRSTASLSDPDAFMNYVVAHKAFELMDRRANSTACREFAEENGSLPPGVRLNSIRTVGVRKS
jgi:hypothetical protein